MKPDPCYSPQSYETAGVLLGITRRSRYPVLVTGLTVAGNSGLTLVLKTTLARPRPPRGGALTPAAGYAFPSGVLWLAIVITGSTVIRNPGVTARKQGPTALPARTGPALPGGQQDGRNGDGGMRRGVSKDSVSSRMGGSP